MFEVLDHTMTQCQPFKTPNILYSWGYIRFPPSARQPDIERHRQDRQDRQEQCCT